MLKTRTPTSSRYGVKGCAGNPLAPCSRAADRSLLGRSPDAATRLPPRRAIICTARSARPYRQDGGPLAPARHALISLALRNGHTGPMTAPTSTGPGRSGPEIRAALAEHAPTQLAEFEREFHQALAGAADSFDTSAVDHVITRWWQIAV